MMYLAKYLFFCIKQDLRYDFIFLETILESAIIYSLSIQQ